MIAMRVALGDAIKQCARGLEIRRHDAYGFQYLMSDCRDWIGVSQMHVK